MTDNNAQAIIDTATRATEPHQLGPDELLHSIVVPAGGQHTIVDLEKYGDNPRRKTGVVHAHDADSFAKYVTKHQLDETEIWADEANTRVVAVINAHAPKAAGWRDHRALLAVRKTDAWKAWAALDGKPLDQVTFAEHIEDRAVDIVRPTGAEMLELAQSFQAKAGVEFESSKRLSSGESQLLFKETVSATAGQRGQLDIPHLIDLALVPFQGAPAYKVTARFRYRINGGRLVLSYHLERPEDVLREAFANVVSDIAERVDPLQVFMGWPE